MIKKRRMITIKIDYEDYKRIKKWAFIRNMKIYQVINKLINK